MASTRDLVKAWINEQIDNGVDFTDKEARIESRKKFLNAHPDQKDPTVQAAWSKVLPQIAKERKIAITQVRQPRRAPKEYDTGALDAQVTPEPVEVEAGRIGLPPGQKQKQEQGGGRQQQQQQGGQGQGGGAYDQYERKTYTVRAIGAFFNGLYTGIRAVIPEAEPLTEAEKETLGELWVDHFNVILAERPKLSIVMALGGTLGLLGGKIIEGRRAQKKREEAEDIINRTKDKAKRSAQRGQEREEPKDAREAGFEESGSHTTYDDGEMESGAEAHPRRTERNTGRRVAEPDKGGDE